jgi:hypothetical protein
MLRSVRSGFQSRHGQEICSSLKRFTPALQPIQSPIQRVPGSLSGIKRPGREVFHCPLSNAKVKGEWGYSFVPLVCLHVLDANGFDFFMFKSLINSKIS